MNKPENRLTFVILVILILLFVWYFWIRRPAQQKVKPTSEQKPEQGLILKLKPEGEQILPEQAQMQKVIQEAQSQRSEQQAEIQNALQKAEMQKAQLQGTIQETQMQIAEQKAQLQYAVQEAQMRRAEQQAQLRNAIQEAQIQKVEQQAQLRNVIQEAQMKMAEQQTQMVSLRPEQEVILLKPEQEIKLRQEIKQESPMRPSSFELKPMPEQAMRPVVEMKVMEVDRIFELPPKMLPVAYNDSHRQSSSCCVIGSKKYSPCFGDLY